VRDLSGTDLATGKAPMAHGASMGQRSEGLSHSTGSTSAIGGPAAVPSPFPYELNNATTGYSRSMHSTMSSYVEVEEIAPEDATPIGQGIRTLL
jgi:hypothetical protein